METITLNIEKMLLVEAQKLAESQHTTLDAVFSSALRRLTSGSHLSGDYRGLMADLRHIDSGGKRFREDMNDRY